MVIRNTTPNGKKKKDVMELYQHARWYRRYCGYSEQEENIKHSLSVRELYFILYFKFRATSQMLHITATAL